MHSKLFFTPRPPLETKDEITEISFFNDLTKCNLIISDAILGELCALESHFPTSSSTSTASSTTSSTGTVLHRAATPSSVNSSTLNTDPNQNDTASSTGEAGSNCLPTPVPPPPPPLMMSSQENIQKYLMSSEPQYITAESVRQNKLMMSNVVNKHEVQKPTLHSVSDCAFFSGRVFENSIL